MKRGLIFIAFAVAGMALGLSVHAFVIWSFDYASMRSEDRFGVALMAAIGAWAGLLFPVTSDMGRKSR